MIPTSQSSFCIQLGSWNIFTSISCWFGTFRLPCNPMMCLLKAQVTWRKKKTISFSRVIPGFETITQSRKNSNQWPHRIWDWSNHVYLRVGISDYLSITPRCHRVSSNKCLPWFQPSTPLWILRGLQMQSIQRHATHSWSRSWQRPESQLLRLRRSMQRCLGSCEVLLSKSPIWWGSA